MNDCPCGQYAPYTDCCGPFLRGNSYPDTAEELMRSRFSAHVKKNWGYLLKTLCAEERKKESVKDMDSGATWTRLEINSTSKGEIEDSQGEVVFTAYFHQGDDQEQIHRETAQFIRENGRWVYSGELSDVELPENPEGGVAPAPIETFVRDEPKVGRNDPCTCGSGKKFKKCCGK